MAISYIRTVKTLPKTLTLECFYCKTKNKALKKPSLKSPIISTKRFDYYCYCKKCNRYLSEELKIKGDW